MTKLLKVDLHMHTCASKDGGPHPAQLIGAAKRKGLDRIAITDHNTIRGALVGQAIDPHFVIVGEEIRTEFGGEILAFFVKEEIPPDLPVAEALARLKAQDAVISISHPFDPRRNPWGTARLEKFLSALDAIEGFNARAKDPAINRRAQAFANTHNLPVTAGSDAHVTAELATAYLKMPAFSTAPEFRQSLRQATICGHLSPGWVSLYSTVNTLRQRWGLKPELPRQYQANNKEATQC